MTRRRQFAAGLCALSISGLAVGCGYPSAVASTPRTSLTHKLAHHPSSTPGSHDARTHRPGIVYAAAQRQEIVMQAHRAHIPSVYVPIHDTPWTKFTGATHYIITTSQPSWTMLSVSYTNIGFQESAQCCQVKDLYPEVSVSWHGF